MSARCVTLTALLLAACAPQVDRCAELRALADRCLGTKLGRLDCELISDVDLERVTQVTRGLSCELIVESLPLDGDVSSAACRLGNVGCVKPTNDNGEWKPTRYPLVLVNGIDTSPLFRYSQRIQQGLREVGGHTVFLATLTPYETRAVRSRELWSRVQAVREETGAPKVNLICHSLGGLDCRYLVSPNGLGADLGVDIASSVASITTVGTAHRGTRVVDVMLGLTPDDRSAQLVDDFASLAGDWFSEQALATDVHLREAMSALTQTQAGAFNAQVIDAPGIRYESWAGVSRPLGQSTAELDARIAQLCGESAPAKHDFMALPLVPFADIASGPNGAPPEPNDGLINVASAQWGTFRGCVAADHMEQLGQRNLPDANVQTGFDVARFYARMATDLARSGL